MTVQKQELTPQAGRESLNAPDLEIMNFIQAKSEAGQLVTSEEIFEDLVQKGTLKSEGEGGRTKLETLLKEMIKNREELKRISGNKKDSHYYSARGMTEAYAGILIQKGEDPLLLMVETIRDNSRRYPRPVRLDLFKEPPCSLSPAEIFHCLKRMAEQEQYQDIAQTTTSIGTLFLFSKLHLEADYASMLAEWLDVGQAMNP
jgi:hypothetical protein